MTDYREKARALASDIDAILHSGQRAEPRYRKTEPAIFEFVGLAYAEGLERGAEIAMEIAAKEKPGVEIGGFTAVETAECISNAITKEATAAREGK